MKKSKFKKHALIIATVLTLIGSLYGYVKYSVHAQINPQKMYYTIEDIPPRTQITEAMLLERQVANDSIPPNAVRNKEDIVGKYTDAGFGLAANSLFYKDVLVNKDELPDAGILELKGNEVAFPLLVNLETSIGNSLMKNTLVDLYFQTKVKDNETQQEKVIYGKVASKARVVAVKDAQAANVFDPEDYEEGKSKGDGPNKNVPMANLYVLAIQEDMNEILNKGKLIGEIVPVATGKSYSSIHSSVSKLEQSEVITYIENSSLSKDQLANKEEVNE